MSHTVRPALAAAALAAAALAVLLLDAGCSASPQVTPLPGPSTESVAWVDGVCNTLKPFVDAASAGPQITGSDAPSAVKGLSDYFRRTAGTLDGTISGLGATGPSPVAGGDEIIRTMTTEYTGYRTDLQAAVSKVDAIDVSNPQSLAKALPAAVAGLPATLDSTAELKKNRELGMAVDQASACRALPASG